MFPPPSPVGRCCVVRESWLMGGDWQDHIGEKMGRGNEISVSSVLLKFCFTAFRPRCRELFTWQTRC